MSPSDLPAAVPAEQDFVLGPLGQRKAVGVDLFAGRYQNGRTTMTKYLALAGVAFALAFALPSASADAMTLAPLGASAHQDGITRIDYRCGRFRHWNWRWRRCVLN